MERRPNAFLTAALLLLPYFGLLCVPAYNQRDPALFGFPFFYWYQLLWIAITVALTWLAYRRVRHDDQV